jgi:hypothetical protein
MTFHGGVNVTIAGPTDLGIGQQSAPVAGWTAVFVPVFGRVGLRYAPSGGSSGGGEAPAESGEQCTGMCGGAQGVFGNCCPDQGWHCVISADELRAHHDSATGTCALN